MGIERDAIAASKQARDLLGQPRRLALGEHREGDGGRLALDLDADRPPRGRATTPSATRLSRSLTLFFGSVAGGPCQDRVCFAPLHEVARDLLGVAEVDLGAGRSRRAKGEPRELQLGRGL